jgi:hypothetical protein
MALLLAACDPQERVYIRDGIGTQLYTADTASATELQSIYLDYLCRQSRSFVGADVPSCAQQLIPDSLWPVIVQAGMNDIDARCDAYLAWLDQKKRENSAILAEISSIRFAVDALTNPNITGVSAVGLAAISAAFGLATNTVNNFNMLLLNVDHTTVQNVVIPNRQIFREDLLKVSEAINSKPAAVHTLRSYLSICMPMTIAANINSTVTVFQQTGTAVGGAVPPTLGVPFTPRQKFGERTPPPTQPDTVRGAETIIDGYPANARIFTPEVINSILVGLCAPASEHKQITVITKTLLSIWEETDTSNATPNGKIDTKRERQALDGLSACPNGILNFFERQTFANKDGSLKSTKQLTDLLDLAPPAKGANGGLLGAAVPLATARPRIAQLRRDCFANIRQLPSEMAGQVTFDFMDALASYAEKRKGVAAGTPLPPC